MRRLAALEGVCVPSIYATSLDTDTGFHIATKSLAPEAALPVQRTLVPNLNLYPFPYAGRRSRGDLRLRVLGERIARAKVPAVEAR